MADLPDIETKPVDILTMGCTHEMAYQKSVTPTPLLPRNEVPAKEYKFILDPFQQEAIRCLDNNRSVLISAHTSAGKTVIAE